MCASTTWCHFVYTLCFVSVRSSNLTWFISRKSAMTLPAEVLSGAPAPGRPQGLYSMYSSISATCDECPEDIREKWLEFLIEDKGLVVASKHNCHRGHCFQTFITVMLHLLANMVESTNNEKLCSHHHASYRNPDRLLCLWGSQLPIRWTCVTYFRVVFFFFTF